MKPYYEVIYGGLGTGKSTYAVSLLDIKNTFKLGVASPLAEILFANFGGMKRHEKDNKRINLPFKRTSLNSICEDISKVRVKTLFIDDWYTFAISSLFKSPEYIHEKIDKIIDSINRNMHIRRVIIVSADPNFYFPLGGYKKTAIWNKRLFSLADRLTRVDFGVPILIKK